MRSLLPSFFCLFSDLRPVVGVVLLGASLGGVHARTIDIGTCGATPGGDVAVTRVIQEAIDAVSASGGGTVVIPSGLFVSAPIQLRSRVTLRLERGAILRCVSNPAEAARARGFVFAEECENVGIEGPGTLDGNGFVFEQRDGARGRPRLVEFYRVRDASIREVTLLNAASWTCKLQDCDGVRVHGVRILSHAGFNNDGIDIDSRNVVISDCLIDCDDDAICFKSHGATPCENVTVTNCVAASNCNLIKMGTASFGGFRNITVSNCVLRPASENKYRNWKKQIEGVAAATTGLAGIALEIVDGGILDRVCLSNITMSGVQTPIFIRLGGRQNAPGTLRNVVISGITARTESLLPSAIVGIPGHRIDGVVLRDILVEVLGNGTEKHAARAVPEKESGYPENRMFGASLPAYGLYVRHAEGITLDGVRFRLINPDARPAIVLEDAHRIELRHLRADAPTSDLPLLRMKKASSVVVSGFRAEMPLRRFVELLGCAAGAIDLSGNDFTRVEQVGYPAPSAAPGR